MSHDHNNGEQEDICSKKHGGNQFSREAFDPEKAAKHDRKVLNYIFEQSKWGSTADQCTAETSMWPSSVGPSFSRLKKAGAIVIIGKRPTRTGSNAGVYAVASLFNGNGNGGSSVE
jgi:hypothetical protein